MRLGPFTEILSEFVKRTADKITSIAYNTDGIRDDIKSTVQKLREEKSKQITEVSNEQQTTTSTDDE